MRPALALRRPLISVKSFSETFPIARSNSSSLIACSASAFSRSRAARVLLPAGGGSPVRIRPARGPIARSAAKPTAAAANTVRLRRMMAAAVWPLAKKTTMVAPIKPASVKNCQGSNGCVSVEVSELIIQAGVEIRIDGVVGTGHRRCRRPGPASRDGDHQEQRRDAEHVRECPGQTVEAFVERFCQRLLA